MLVFVEGGKPENREKNPQSKARTNNKPNPHMALSRNRTQATLVGGERSHSAIPAPQNVTWSHLAFPAEDETQLPMAKFKTTIFRRDCLVNDLDSLTFFATFR